MSKKVGSGEVGGASKSSTTTITQEASASHNKSERHPTLRLRLKVAAESLMQNSNTTTCQATVVQRCRDLFSNFFIKSEKELSERKLDDATRLKITEKNKKKIDKIFDELIRLLNEQKEQAKRSLEGLTPQQQEHVVAYWRNAAGFLSELFQWLNDLFVKILDKIKQGYTLNQKAVKQLFDEFFMQFKEIFNADAFDYCDDDEPPSPKDDSNDVGNQQQVSHPDQHHQSKV
jgi:hypothetical protein